jgi:hypothetical protein
VSGNRRALIEKQERIAHRATVLRTIKQKKEEENESVYLDETRLILKHYASHQ